MLKKTTTTSANITGEQCRSKISKIVAGKYSYSSGNSGGVHLVSSHAHLVITLV